MTEEKTTKTEESQQDVMYDCMVYYPESKGEFLRYCLKARVAGRNVSRALDNILKKMQNEDIEYIHLFDISPHNKFAEGRCRGGFYSSTSRVFPGVLHICTQIDRGKGRYGKRAFYIKELTDNEILDLIAQEKEKQSDR